MRILALETSGKAGSIAVAKDSRLISQLALNPDQRSAQSLTAGIRELLGAIGRKISDIELVAVTIGPGSFTGLRVGVVTAKTLAYALSARIIGLNTLEVIAARADCAEPRLSVAIDAQRGQVFAATFERSAQDTTIVARPNWQMIGGPQLLDNAHWLSVLKPGMAASGPALAGLAHSLPPGVSMIGEEYRAPRAAAVAALAWARHLQNAHDD